MRADHDRNNRNRPSIEMVREQSRRGTLDLPALQVISHVEE